jgi:hypothetical protein
MSESIRKYEEKIAVDEGDGLRKTWHKYEDDRFWVEVKDASSN